jgi:DNA helicase-2/ATP-dependent DNA helicase PcrA
MSLDLDAIVSEAASRPIPKPASGLPPATPEQQAIIEAALRTQDNLLVNALAGAAKTTTLEMLCKSLPVQPILSLAFNKRIAEEMTKRLPGHVECRTLNAIGHRVWMQCIPRRLALDTKKSYTILKGIVDALPRGEKSEAYEFFSDILKLVGQAKLAGYIPTGVPTGRALVSVDDFWSEIDEDLADVGRGLVDRVLRESITQAYAGSIDFDDQIYMPTLFGGTFPKFGLVLVDEAQDLSALNHAMLEKLVVKRLIAVGDPYQSIYAFRGALTTSMATLKARFNMTEMPLSVSFRCPRAIVERARWRAPHMQYPEWAKLGQVTEFIENEWTADIIPDYAAIICRNNAPLFKLAFALIRAGRGVSIVGADIGPSLVKALKKLGPEHLNGEQAYEAIDKWEKEKLAKAKGKATIKDKAECLRVFVDIGGSLAGAVAYAESIFKTTGSIQLLSGHKSKGLEWDHVFHLDPGRIPSPYAEDLEQEYNVRYVIETRAKESLTLIDMDLYRRK